MPLDSLHKLGATVLDKTPWGLTTNIMSNLCFIHKFLLTEMHFSPSPRSNALTIIFWLKTVQHCMREGGLVKLVF